MEKNELTKREQLNEYMRLHCEVFGYQGKVALCYWLASVMCRKMELRMEPLWVQGEKGSGKTQLVQSITALSGNHTWPDGTGSGRKVVAYPVEGVKEVHRIMESPQAVVCVDDYVESMQLVHEACSRKGGTVFTSQYEPVAILNDSVLYLQLPRDMSGGGCIRYTASDNARLEALEAMRTPQGWEAEVLKYSPFVVKMIGEEYLKALGALEYYCDVRRAHRTAVYYWATPLAVARCLWMSGFDLPFSQEELIDTFTTMVARHLLALDK